MLPGFSADSLWSTLHGLSEHQPNSALMLETLFAAALAIKAR